MSTIEDDPILGRFFDTSEKKAKWLVRLKLVYILWILFIIIGFCMFMIWYVFG
jgi:hypothetical protein